MKSPLEIRMSAAAIKLANIQTSMAESQVATKKVRLTGKVQTDEMNVFSQTSHIAGRIESLSVNFTGEYIKRGQVLANIYSPELVTAQKELFEAAKIKETQPALFQAAREKLLNWKLTNRQIDRILSEGKVKEQLPIYADVSGIVTEKSVNLGDYIKKGAVLYQITDLSKLWVLFDVYESDLTWVNVSSKITYSVQSMPGESFEGEVNFIDPVINPATRVAKARISVRNKEMQLKPEMFVNGIVETTINENSIIIPNSATLWTGSRSIIYVKNQSATGVSFELREVVLGPSLGDSYVVEDGLDAGEEYVVNGTFSVDAAAQLAGKPSMMNPEGNAAPIAHDHGTGASNPVSKVEIPDNLESSTEVKALLNTLIEGYIALKSALASDDFEKASAAANSYWSSYNKINMGMFEGPAHNFWMAEGAPIEGLAKKIKDANEISEARIPFKPLSAHMINLARTFQPSGNKLFIQYCPMADDFKGASWLSYEENILNPYFGASMLTCGEVTDTIDAGFKPSGTSKPAAKSPHTEAMGNIGSNHVHIDYSSPRVRGRVIFGGLVPFDEVWSTGAHRATSIAFTKDVEINQTILKADKYALFTIPGRNSWTVILNRNWDQHLADEYSEKDDLIRFKVSPKEESEVLEELTFTIASKDNESGVVKFQWANTSFEFIVNNK